MVKKWLSRLASLKAEESQQPHQPVVVLGLELQGAHDVDSDDALLGAAVRQLPELPRRGRHRGVVRQRVHLHRALQNSADSPGATYKTHSAKSGLSYLSYTYALCFIQEWQNYSLIHSDLEVFCFILAGFG